MNTPSPSGWTDQLWRAVVTLLVAAVAVYVAWRLFSAVMPMLIVIVVLLAILRLAIGGYQRRSGW